MPSKILPSQLRHKLAGFAFELTLGLTDLDPFFANKLRQVVNTALLDLAFTAGGHSPSHQAYFDRVRLARLLGMRLLAQHLEVLESGAPHTTDRRSVSKLLPKALDVLGDRIAELDRKFSRTNLKIALSSHIYWTFSDVSRAEAEDDAQAILALLAAPKEGNRAA